MDDDSFVLEQIPENLVSLFDKRKYKWGGRLVYPDVSMVTWGLPELTRYFLTTHRVTPTTLWAHCDPPGWSGLFSSADNASEAELQLRGSWIDSVTPRAGGWDRQVIEGSFMLISLEMYFRPLFQRFVELCRTSGGTGQYRWNQQSVLAMAVQLFVEKDELYVGTFEYIHTQDTSKALQFWAGLPDTPWSNAALTHVGQQIQQLTASQPVTWLGASAQPCEIEHVGKGWGEHRLCQRSPAKPCVFYSFGISTDFSFDTQLAKLSECKGYCFDPTVSHDSQLGDNLLFFKTAASSLDEELNRHWDAWTSVPRFKKWQGHARISVLKMDCEGCEFAIARDVEREEPDFWQKVDQFAVEIHVPKKFMPTDEHVIELGRLFSQLELAGLHLRDAMMTSCSQEDESTGCHPMLQKVGYPCEKEQMCQNLLFAR
ncbi:hypothetical protein HYH03_018059 [Edaphochlamys debaryana]|uniref:Methyltransferase domain-containing protein n=1 Tax=Edaphochlamys debaryana TaxID=47281 RepID=A0A835XGM8_9CHLO|nr:hypothetical protein HYH03_018059 [Edaphochlamys debaryana]|eukprot:KAG2483029.1 hypothetical protein HYH03_018059 [Edaphochlamys debaryana]